MPPLLPTGARTASLDLTRLARLLGVGPLTTSPHPVPQSARAAAWPRTTTGRLRRPYSTRPSTDANAHETAGVQPDEKRPSRSPADEDQPRSEVIALPAPSPRPPADPEPEPCVDHPTSAPESQQSRPAAQKAISSFREQTLQHESGTSRSTSPSSAVNAPPSDLPPKRSRPDASSTLASPSTSSVHPPDWRPPFPLPTDLATTLFRMRSLYVSTSHLVRGRLTDGLLRLENGLRATRATFEEERVRLLTAGKLVFGQVGGRVNSVTGYDGIERLKESVRVREDALTQLRAALSTAKTTYHLTLTSASASQRELNDLLQRKHSWSSSDVERFTLLVREDHQSSSAATHAKDEVERLEAEADKAFDGLMRAILQRYHEEQTWSDKLRSLSSYTQLLVLGVNALLFLGAVAVVEPWKRRRMVQGFEGRVREMTAELGSTFRAEIDGLRQEMAAGDLSPASKRPLDIPAATPSSSLPPRAAINAPSSGLALADDPAVLPPPSVAHLLEPATAPSSPAPLLLPHPTFPYHYPSPALLAMPVQAAMAAKERCVRAWADPNSSDRQFAVAAGVGAGVGALIVALCKG